MGFKKKGEVPDIPLKDLSKLYDTYFDRLPPSPPSKPQKYNPNIRLEESTESERRNEAIRVVITYISLNVITIVLIHLSVSPIAKPHEVLPITLNITALRWFKALCCIWGIITAFYNGLGTYHLLKKLRGKFKDQEEEEEKWTRYRNIKKLLKELRGDEDDDEEGEWDRDSKRDMVGSSLFGDRNDRRADTTPAWYGNKNPWRQSHSESYAAARAKATGKFKSFGPMTPRMLLSKEDIIPEEPDEDNIDATAAPTESQGCQPSGLSLALNTQLAVGNEGNCSTVLEEDEDEEDEEQKSAFQGLSSTSNSATSAISYYRRKRKGKGKRKSKGKCRSVERKPNEGIACTSPACSRRYGVDGSSSSHSCALCSTSSSSGLDRDRMFLYAVYKDPAEEEDYPLKATENLTSPSSHMQSGSSVEPVSSYDDGTNHPQLPPPQSPVQEQQQPEMSDAEREELEAQKMRNDELSRVLEQGNHQEQQAALANMKHDVMVRIAEKLAIAASESVVEEEPRNKTPGLDDQEDGQQRAEEEDQNLEHGQISLPRPQGRWSRAISLFKFKHLNPYQLPTRFYPFKLLKSKDQTKIPKPEKVDGEDDDVSVSLSTKKRTKVKRSRIAILVLAIVAMTMVTSMPPLLLIGGDIIAHDYQFEHACDGARWDILLDASGLHPQQDNNYNRAVFLDRHSQGFERSFTMNLEGMSSYGNGKDVSLILKRRGYVFYLSDKDLKDQPNNGKSVRFPYPVVIAYDMLKHSYYPHDTVKKNMDDSSFFKDGLYMNGTQCLFPNEGIWLEKVEQDGYCGQPKRLLKNGFDERILWTVIDDRKDCTRFRMCGSDVATRRQVTIATGMILLRVAFASNCCSKEGRGTQSPIKIGTPDSN